MLAYRVQIEPYLANELPIPLSGEERNLRENNTGTVALFYLSI
jgi:hypothetical protein